METEELMERELLELLIQHRPEKYGGLKGIIERTPRIRHNKKQISYDLPDLLNLPPGQPRAVEALIGGEVALATSLRIFPPPERPRHPELYKVIRSERLSAAIFRVTGSPMSRGLNDQAVKRRR